MSVEASGKNMKVVCDAKEHHNKTCPYGGNATAVHMSFFDVDRLGWEEGDVICGLTLVVRRQRPVRSSARDVRRRA